MTPRFDASRGPHSELIEAYRQGLSEVIRLQHDSVKRVCSRCEAPCCERVEHLFDEKDLIYSRLCLGRKKPFKRARHVKGCPYLASSGCRLEPQERPFICHRFVCQRLEEAMRKEDPGRMKRLDDTLRHLEGLRSRLWEAYLDSGKSSHPS